MRVIGKFLVKMSFLGPKCWQNKALMILLPTTIDQIYHQSNYTQKANGIMTYIYIYIYMQFANSIYYGIEVA